MTNSTCKFEACKSRAIFKSDFCWDHLGDKESYRDFLSEHLKKGASLKGENLSRVDLKDADLSRQDLSSCILSRANLSNANLFDSSLKGAELLGANLSGSDLTSANLEKADLTKASLRGARLWHANLEGSNLIEADLSGVDFWNAKLYNARFWHTVLAGAISFSKQSFSKRVHRYLTIHGINEGGLHSAEEAYRSFKRHFLNSGRYDDASWASFKEKSIQRLLLKKEKNITYIPSLIMSALCGYGEKPHRIILSSFFVITFYAFLYKAMNAIYYTDSRDYVPKTIDYIYYSVITFTTAGYGDFIPRAFSSFRLLAASQAFIGAFMIGLFIFTLARKYSAR